MLHGHLSWHAALWALQDGDADIMWSIVDTSIAPGATQSLPVNVLTDMAAICFRAELAGFAVAPDRWARLSDYATRYFPSTGQSFADMHAALAHARAGEGGRLAHIAESAQGFAGDLVRPVARAWAAMARQNWAEARDDLLPVMSQPERIGGSRAQRDLIELAYVSVLLRLGQTDEADALLPCDGQTLRLLFHLQALPTARPEDAESLRDRASGWAARQLVSAPAKTVTRHLAAFSGA